VWSTSICCKHDRPLYRLCGTEHFLVILYTRSFLFTECTWTLSRRTGWSSTWGRRRPGWCRVFAEAQTIRPTSQDPSAGRRRARTQLVVSSPAVWWAPLPEPRMDDNVSVLRPWWWRTVTLAICRCCSTDRRRCTPSSACCTETSLRLHQVTNHKYQLNQSIKN